MKVPHRNYLTDRALVDQVFRRFECSLGRPCMAALHREFSVPSSTLRGWYNHFQQDAGWRPYNYDAHGAHHRIFTDQEEEAIAQFIEDNYFAQGYAFHNEDFKKIAVDAFLMKYQDAETVPEFQCSPGFITDFKERNNISQRRAHYKRRPDVDAAAVARWIAMISELAQNVPLDRIVNADETCWRILPSGLTTWAKKGAENISICTKDDEKQKITVMASITAAGTKLPLFVIAKGSTSVVETTQIGDIAPHFTHHTPNGWMDAESFKRYLMLLRERCFQDDEIVFLIVDCYPAHCEQSVKETAEALNIELLYIPPGMTDKCQPLDRRIFGALKQKAKKYIYQKMSESPEQKIGMLGAVQVLVACWEGITLDLVHDAWSLFLDEL